MAWHVVPKFVQKMDVDGPKVDLEGQGHRSNVKVTRSKNGISLTFYPGNRIFLDVIAYGNR